MTAIYRRFAGAGAGMADETYAAKRLIMQISMASEINELGHHLDRISERNRLFRDFTLPSLARALREVVAAFPVYRTYVGEDGGEPGARDQAYIEHAVASAGRRNPTVNVSVFDFVRDALLLRYPAAADAEERAERRLFAMRFQQITGPVTAKAVEDTAHYRYNRLVSLNEVGSDPAHFGEPTAVFHDKNARRLARWPDTLLCTATHDTSGARTSPDQRSLRCRAVGAEVQAGARSPAASSAGSTDRRPPIGTRVSALPDARRRVAPARGRRGPPGLHHSHPRIHAEGHERGQAPHELGQSQWRVRRGRRGVRHAAPRTGQPVSRGLAPVP
jgi:hypothetical protein